MGPVRSGERAGRGRGAAAGGAAVLQEWWPHGADPLADTIPLPAVGLGRRFRRPHAVLASLIALAVAAAGSIAALRVAADGERAEAEVLGWSACRFSDRAVFLYPSESFDQDGDCSLFAAAGPGTPRRILVQRADRPLGYRAAFHERGARAASRTPTSVQGRRALVLSWAGGAVGSLPCAGSTSTAYAYLIEDRDGGTLEVIGFACGPDYAGIRALVERLVGSIRFLDGAPGATA